MNSPNNISFWQKILYLCFGNLLVVTVSAVFSINSINSIKELRRMEYEVNDCLTELYTIDHQLHLLADSGLDSAAGSLRELSVINAGISSIGQTLNAARENPHLEAQPVIRSLIDTITQHLSVIAGTLDNLSKAGTDQEASYTLKALCQSTLLSALSDVNELREELITISFTGQREYSLSLLVTLIISILIIMSLMLLVFFGVHRNLSQLVGFLRAFQSGSRPERLQVYSDRDFREMADLLNSILARQDKMIRYLKTIGEGSLPESFNPEEGDMIGQEITVMAERLQNIQTQEKLRHAEDQKMQWTSEGIAQFAEILRSERENVEQLSFLIIKKLVTYLRTEMGTLYLTSKDEEEQDILETIAAYAYDRRKYLKRSFRFGEGLPGTCALEKEKIYMDDIPEEYSEIISGIGHSKPRFILLVPLKIQEEVFGIIELASFKGFEEYELNFVDQLAESIATTLMSVKTNERTALLLGQSQEQAAQLIRQEESIKSELKLLQEKLADSQAKEFELGSSMSSLNDSILMAEFGLNGRFQKINPRFLNLLESPSEIVLGKHHKEFAQVDSYSDAYKNFWEELKSGESSRREDLFRLFSGKELWLYQTFMPLSGKEGKINRVLCLAFDFTEIRKQREVLEKRNDEIQKKNTELEGLYEAVDRSIIKCELDQEAVIIDINKNFEGMSGLDRKEMLGRNYRNFLKEQEKEQFKKIWTEVLKGKTYQGVLRRTRPTGEEVWLMSSFSPVRDDEGRIIRIYFLALDITEKKLKYQLLEEANKEIERLRGMTQT